MKFTDHLCVIHDRTSRMLIGTGEEHEGLYVVTDDLPVRVHKLNGLQNAELWHRRLGHPSR